MGLLDNPPHTATVYPVVQVDDGYGSTQPGEGEPVETRCSIQPRSAGDPSNEPGYYAETMFTMIARSLPAGAWSRVTFSGDDYTVVGDTQRFRMSPATSHDQALLRKR